MSRTQTTSPPRSTLAGKQRAYRRSPAAATAVSAVQYSVDVPRVSYASVIPHCSQRRQQQQQQRRQRSPASTDQLHDAWYPRRQLGGLSRRVFFAFPLMFLALYIALHVYHPMRIACTYSGIVVKAQLRRCGGCVIYAVYTVLFMHVSCVLSRLHEHGVLGSNGVPVSGIHI